MLQIMLGENVPDLEVIEKCPDLPTGVRAIKKHNPHLIFLDIEMPGYSGLQLLDFFNEEEINFDIIFTTAFNDYAIRAFEMSAIDYLLKPIQIDKLVAAVERFKRKGRRSSFSNQQLSLLRHNMSSMNRKIAVPVTNGYEILQIDDVIYLEADGSYTRIILRDGQPFVVSKKLKYFEDLLEDNPQFFRLHRSYMVNLDCIKKFLRLDGGKVILHSGTELPVSSDRFDDLARQLSVAGR